MTNQYKLDYFEKALSNAKDTLKFLEQLYKDTAIIDSKNKIKTMIEEQKVLIGKINESISRYKRNNPSSS